MPKLEQLTSEQQAQLAPWRDQWLAHGLSTEPADRPRAESGVRAAYEAAGLTAPTLYIWLDSPLAGAYGAAMLAFGKVGDQVRDQVRDQVWAQVGAQVGDQVWAQVWAQVGAQVGDQVWAQVGDQVGAQVGDQVGAQVWAQVGDQVRAQVWAQVGDQVQAQVRAQVYKSAWGQHDAGWLSFYDYMHNVTGIAAPARLHGVNEVAKSAGWWWPFAGAVILTERPTVVQRDADNRLHAAEGPALAYPDGFAVHAWHGERVPASLVTGDGWTIQEILSEENLEIRRCAIERMGWDQFIQAADLRPVDRCDDPGNPGFGIALYDLPDDMNPYEDAVRILLVANGSLERDGTRRRFGLSVPANIPTALAAAAWGYHDDDHPVQMTPDMYATTARRS